MIATLKPDDDKNNEFDEDNDDNSDDGLLWRDVDVSISTRKYYEILFVILVCEIVITKCKN